MWQQRTILFAACVLLLSSTATATFEQWNAITASATANLAYDGYTVDATSGSITFTLPDINTGGGNGVIFEIKRTDNSASSVTIASAVSGQTFDGSATLTLHVYRAIKLLALNSKWYIISGWDN